MSMARREPLKRAPGARRGTTWNVVVHYQPVVAEILADPGADWGLFDMEHSHADLPTTLAQLHAARGGQADTIVRPPSHEPEKIKRLLDIGAGNLLAPFVNNAAEARRLVSAMRYH